MIYKYIDRKTNKICEEKSVIGTPFLYKNPLGGLALKVAKQRFVSRIAGWYLNKKRTTKYIKGFIKDNNIDMEEYPEVEYKCFNEFFSRKIKEGRRIFSNNKKDFCSPCDSRLQVFKIDEKEEFTIKKHKYTLESLLRDKKLANEYKNGYLMVFRLFVDDYHRYTFIDDGKVIKTRTINGKYHNVGPIAFEKHKIYPEAQREYSVLKTENFGEIIQMEVGAMLVGKIVNYDIKKFSRGEEKGYFLYGGSTIIIIVKENTLKIDQDILDNSKVPMETKVKQGEKIAVAKE